jgi:GMP synthase-like glutamine amidotransferase
MEADIGVGRPVVNQARSHARSPRVLVIQHYPGSPAGLIADEARASGAVLEVMNAEHGCELPPTPEPYDGLLLLGGVMGALDDHVCPHFPDLLRLARAFEAEGKPVLGICLGGQLLARAYGGSVHYQRHGEFGFIAPRATDHIASDPLLRGLGGPPPIMQWHNDSFEPPAGAVALLTGTDCPWQAFRMGRRTWAFQGHVEVTRDDAQAWGNLRSQWRNEPEAPLQVARYLGSGWTETEQFGRALAGRWLGMCAEAALERRSGHLRAAK